MSGPTEIQITSAVFIALIAAITDFWRGKIYNWLTLAGLLIGLSIGYTQSGLPGLGFSLLGAGMGFSLLLLPYLQKGLAAGDVKLFIALGAIMGHSSLIEVAFFSLIVAGFFAVVQLLRARRLIFVIKRFVGMSPREDVSPPKPELKLPLGLPVLLGLLVWWSRRGLG